MPAENTTWPNRVIAELKIISAAQHIGCFAIESLFSSFRQIDHPISRNPLPSSGGQTVSLRDNDVTRVRGRRKRKIASLEYVFEYDARTEDVRVMDDVVANDTARTQNDTIAVRLG